MFQELMPLIQNRPLTITVAAVGGAEIRVNVVPQPTDKDKKANDQIGYSHNKEVAAIPEEAIRGLTTPLCLTGTPQEIDAELVNTLTNFSNVHAGLQHNFDAAAAAIRDSVKAIDERERIKKEKDKANNKKLAPAKAEDKKPEDAGLPLFTSDSPNPPAMVSANDEPRSSVPTQSGLALENPTAPANDHVVQNKDQREEEQS